MKKHYTNRLMVLARHLGSDHFIEAISGASPVYTTDFTVHGIEYFGWAIDALPHLFPTYWGYNDNSVPYYVGQENLSPLSAAAKFFGITGEEILHLMSPGYQDISMGLKLLPQANSGEVAYNIYQFVSYKKSKLTTDVLT